MRTKVHTDGFDGWAKRAKARAEAMTDGRAFPASKGITFENAAFDCSLRPGSISSRR